MKRKFFLRNLLRYILPLFISLLIFGVSSMVIAQKYIKDTIDKNTASLLNQAKEMVDLVLNEIDQLSLVFDINSQIVVKMDTILDEKGISYESSVASTIINEYINADKNARPYIHSIYVHYDKHIDNFYTSTEGRTRLSNFYDTSWHDEYTNHFKEDKTWTAEREFTTYPFEGTPTKVVSIFHRMTLRDGVIVMNIRPKYINDILKKATANIDQSLLVVDSNNQIIFSNIQGEYFTEDFFRKVTSSDNTSFRIDNNRKNYIVSQLKSQRFNWGYISVIPENSLYHLSNELMYLLIIILFITFLSGMALAYISANKNYKQVSKIFDILDAAESENSLPALPTVVNDEYTYIIENLIKTFIEQSYLKLTLSEKKYRHKTMELLALQGQINHHFIFNTMKTIYWKVYALTNNQNIACDMIEDLSAILSYALESPTDFVPLRDEINNTKSYLEIQQIRFPNKFTVIWDYSPEIHEFKVLRLLLQPLVENSISHGISEKDGKCIIKIRILLNQDIIRISVIDNGLGIDKQSLKTLRNKLDSDEDHFNHIGLFNNNRRLILTYGDIYRINILSHKGLGTSVQIRIPITNNNEINE